MLTPNGLTHELFKFIAYKVGVSLRLFKLQILSLFEFHFASSGESRNLNEHLRTKLRFK